MLITNKIDLLEKLKLNVSKDYIYLTKLSRDYILNIFSYLDTCYLHNITEQSIDEDVDNNYKYIYRLESNSEEYKLLKKYLSLKSSRIEIKDDKLILQRIKQTKKDPEPIIIDETIINLEVMGNLPFDFSNLEYTNLISCLDYSNLPEKIDTKFEFEAYNIHSSIHINSKLLPTIHKIFNDRYIDVEYNVENNICRILDNDSQNYLYIKCLDKIS